MKKYIAILLLVSIISTNAFSQTQKAKDSLMKVMVAEACEEIVKKDFSTLGKDELEMELGMAIIPVFTNHLEEMKEIFDVDMSDAGKVTQFGQTLGMRLAMECPGFMKVVSGNKTFQEMAVGKSTEKITLSGTLQKIVPGDITHFIIKTESGRLEKIWWMAHFDGAEKLMQPGNLNKKLSIQYKEMEVYNAAVKDYIKIKVATGMGE
ncbi:MAG: hypothetical protein ABIO05_03365 [Ferruginibacter sp.]